MFEIRVYPRFRISHRIEPFFPLISLIPILFLLGSSSCGLLISSCDADFNELLPQVEATDYGDVNESDEEEIEGAIASTSEPIDTSNSSDIRNLIDDSATINESEVVTLNILANDRIVFGDQSSLVIGTIYQPQYGSVFVNYDDTITYAPFQMPLPPNTIITDSFSYTASADNGIQYYAAQVSISINQVNDAPIAFDANYTMKENGQISIHLNGFDEDGESLSFSVAQEPKRGNYVLNPDTGTLVYTPFYNFTGEDWVMFTVTDSAYTSKPGYVMITVEEQPETGSTYVESFYPAVDNNEDLDNTDNSTDTSRNQGSESNESDDSDSEPDSSDSSSDNNELPSDVEIDILPGIYPNKINTNKGNELVEVAILGSDSLDLSSDLDLDSLKFGPSSSSPSDVEFKDVNNDGFIDLNQYYRIADLDLQNTDVQACQSGEIQYGGKAIAFEACDSIKVTNQNN